MHGSNKALAALAALLAVAAPHGAGAARTDERTVALRVRAAGIIEAGALVTELAARLPAARVLAAQPAAATSTAYAVALAPEPPPDQRVRLRVRAPDGETILSHVARVSTPAHTARELAVLIEGAIRLHRRQIEELLRRLAADVPLLALSVHLGGRAFPNVPRIAPLAGVALRLRLFRLVAALELDGALPWAAAQQQVDHRVQLYSLRATLAYPAPLGPFVALFGVGVELSLFVCDFDLPDGEQRQDSELSVEPQLIAELEWPRDGRLRLVGAGAVGAAASYPEFRWDGQRVIAPGPFSARLSLGARWMF